MSRRSSPIHLSLWLLAAVLLNAGAQQLQIKVGMLIPRNETLPYAYSSSASAVTLAIERLYKDNILSRDQVNFTILYRFEECVEATSAGYAYELITNDKIDALIAPPCTDGATVSGHIATFFNIPVLMWGSTLVSDLADPLLYPTVVNIMPTYSDFSKIICDVMEYFKWESFAFVYQADDHGGCFSFQRDLEEVTATRSDCVVSFKDQVNSWESEDINYTISMIQQRSRILVLCFDDIDQKRSFALSLFDAGMTTEDYVYIFPDTDLLLAAADDQSLPFWMDRYTPTDGRNADAEAIGRRGFQLHSNMDTKNAGNRFVYNNFTREVVTKMKAWPFFCTDCDHGQNASVFAPYLYDLFYLYGVALRKTFNTSGTNSSFYRNGTLLSDNSNAEFEGLTGRVVMGKKNQKNLFFTSNHLGLDGVRDSSYVLSEYDAKNQLSEYILFQVVGSEVNVTEIVNESAIWASRNGFKPVSVPLCGFDGKGCPLPVFQQYMALFICVIVVVIFIVFAAVSTCLYLIHIKAQEKRRLNEMWQIAYALLSRVSSKSKDIESSRSLQSGYGT